MLAYEPKHDSVHGDNNVGKGFCTSTCAYSS
jgi:hypothetical protein